MELPQSKSGAVWSRRNVNVFFPGDTLSIGICDLENLNVIYLNHSSSFSFSFLEHLTGHSLTLVHLTWTKRSHLEGKKKKKKEVDSGICVTEVPS